MKARMRIIVLFLFVSQLSFSQCEMCKAVVENGDSDMAKGVNSGIIYLMIFPIFIFSFGSLSFSEKV